MYQRHVPPAKPLGHVGCRLRAQIGTTQNETNLIKQVVNGDEIKRDVAGRLRDVAGL